MTLCCGGSVVANDGNYVEFQRILDNKCSQCHTRLRVEDAIEQGADMEQIVAKMIRFGARLSQQEQQVMGIFWVAAAGAKPAAATPAAVDPLREYRAVVQSRCVGCHSLDIVEKAMADDRPISDLIEMMRKRGAIIPEADKNVLGTFWGNPLKVETE